jgi:hypothetical protein
LLPCYAHPFNTYVQEWYIEPVGLIGAIKEQDIRILLPEYKGGWMYKGKSLKRSTFGEILRAKVVTLKLLVNRLV